MMSAVQLIDHVNLPVLSFTRSFDLYRSVLSELGLEVLVTEEDAAGFGRAHWEFGVVQEPGPITPLHVAFSTTSEASVNQFYQLALEAGGRDNGGPGLREEYGPTYYSAYILDFDNHNIEVVFR